VPILFLYLHRLDVVVCGTRIAKLYNIIPTEESIIEKNQIMLSGQTFQKILFHLTATLFPGSELVSPSRVTSHAVRSRLIQVSSGEQSLAD
jgi:hypothetical protein